MRIVLVNWAKLWDGASHGGGVNGYCQALALELTRRGHDVIWLCSGMSFVPDPDQPMPTAGSLPCVGRPFIRRHPDWFKIRVFEVFNSPVVAPSLLQFAEPESEIADAELERCITQWTNLVRPDVVHLHNIEGLTAGCIKAFKAATPAPAVWYSLHNYHTICPQVYLMQGHTRLCQSFCSGKSCENCVDAIDPGLERQERAMQFLKEHASQQQIEQETPDVVAMSPQPAPPVADVSLRKAIRDVLSATRGKTRQVFGSRANQIPEQTQEPAQLQELEPTGQDVVKICMDLPGSGVVSVDDVSVPIKLDQPDDRGTTLSLARENDDRFEFTPEAESWQPVTNQIAPDPVGDAEPNAYARRRVAMVNMLSECDGVLAVSKFVRDKFVSMGVHESVIDTLTIGSRINQVVSTNAELNFDPPRFDAVNPRPIRLVFMGYNNHYKGLQMFAEALELLTPEYLARVDLYINALEGQSIEWRFRRLEPRLARLVFNTGYAYRDIPWMCGGKDLGVVSSVWWDNAPQTVFEFFACGVPVLGANLGGIPDFVRHEHNGLLFEGNNRFDLARQLVRVLQEPELLERMRANVEQPKDIQVHAGELERFYQGRLCSEAEKKPCQAAILPIP